MNLIKASKLLKGAPDTELTQYLKNPTGDFPEYLVASEKLRREEMREKYAAANQGQPTKTSIIEELLQKDTQKMRQQPQQLPEAMGIGSVPPPEGMQLSQAPMMEAAQQQPQQFYDGGVVALAEGGSLEDAIQEYLRPHMYEGKGMQSAGINPSIPVGAGSMDLSAAYNRMGDGVPSQSNVTGRIGGSYPIGKGRLSAGIQGIHAPGYSGITGYDVGYNDEKNRLMANINPTPHGAALGASYGRRLDDDSSIDARLMRDPRGHMSGNLMYTHHFAKGGLAGLSSEIHDYLEGYAAGGEVKHFKAGNVVADPYAIPSWATAQQAVPEAMTQQQAIDFAKSQLGESAVAGYEPFIQARQKKIEENQKNYLPNFLINAGLGMATSAKLNPLQAAAEGALKGFEYHQKAKAADEEAKNQLEESRFKFKAAQRAENAGLIGLSNQLYNSSQDAHRNGVEANRQAVALGLTAAQARDTADFHRQSIGATNREIAVRAADIDERRKEREAALKQAGETRASDRLLKALDVVATKTTNMMQDTSKNGFPEWYTDRQAKLSELSPTARKVEEQRMRQELELYYGITPNLKAMAGLG